MSSQQPPALSRVTDAQWLVIRWIETNPPEVWRFTNEADARAFHDKAQWNWSDCFLATVVRQGAQQDVPQPPARVAALVAEVKTAIVEFDAVIKRHFDGRHALRTTIPAQTTDSDILISGALQHVSEFLAALSADTLEAALPSGWPTEQPEDPSGRLMLNAYGRRCYDAGVESVKAGEPLRDEALRTVRNHLDAAHARLAGLASMMRKDSNSRAEVSMALTELKYAMQAAGPVSASGSGAPCPGNHMRYDGTQDCYCSRCGACLTELLP